MWSFLPLRLFTKMDGYKDGVSNLPASTPTSLRRSCYFMLYISGLLTWWNLLIEVIFSHKEGLLACCELLGHVLPGLLVRDIYRHRMSNPLKLIVWGLATPHLPRYFIPHVLLNWPSNQLLHRKAGLTSCGIESSPMSNWANQVAIKNLWARWFCCLSHRAG